MSPSGALAAFLATGPLSITASRQDRCSIGLWTMEFADEGDLLGAKELKGFVERHLAYDAASSDVDSAKDARHLRCSHPSAAAISGRRR